MKIQRPRSNVPSPKAKALSIGVRTSRIGPWTLFSCRHLVRQIYVGSRKSQACSNGQSNLDLIRFAGKRFSSKLCKVTASQSFQLVSSRLKRVHRLGDAVDKNPRALGLRFTLAQNGK